MKDSQELQAQARTIIRMGEKVLGTESTDHRLTPLVNEEQFHSFRISALSFLSRVFGEESVHSRSLKAEVTHPTASRTRRGIGILNAACDDLNGGWLETTAAEFGRDLLGDILQLARIQGQLGRHPAAAVIAMTVLEKQLRQLSLAAGISLHNEARQGQERPLPKRGLQLCGELYKKKVLSRQENKAVVGWLELGDQAAAEPGVELAAAKLAEMLGGIAAFLGKRP